MEITETEVEIRHTAPGNNKCFSVKNESAGGYFSLFKFHFFVSILGRIYWTPASEQAICLDFMPIT